MSAKNNKHVAIQAKKVLKELGHKVPLGHIYELFSKLNSQPSWNVASKNGTSFEAILHSSAPDDSAPQSIEKKVDTELIGRIKSFFEEAAFDRFLGPEVPLVIVSHQTSPPTIITQNTSLRAVARLADIPIEALTPASPEEAEAKAKEFKVYSSIKNAEYIASAKVESEDGDEEPDFESQQDALEREMDQWESDAERREREEDDAIDAYLRKLDEGVDWTPDEPTQKEVERALGVRVAFEKEYLARKAVKV